MKVQLTHNGNIKAFDDAKRNLKLTSDPLTAIKPNTDVYMTETSKPRGSGKKRKFHDYGFQHGKDKNSFKSGKKHKYNQHKKGKRPSKIQKEKHGKSQVL